MAAFVGSGSVEFATWTHLQPARASIRAELIRSTVAKIHYSQMVAVPCRGPFGVPTCDLHMLLQVRHMFECSPGASTTTESVPQHFCNAPWPPYIRTNSDMKLGQTDLLPSPKKASHGGLGQPLRWGEGVLDSALSSTNIAVKKLGHPFLFWGG